MGNTSRDIRGISYQYSRRFRQAVQFDPGVDSGQDRPEMLLLLAIIDRAKRDYLACPREEWPALQTKIEGLGTKRWDGDDARRLLLARAAYTWCTAIARTQFSYQWIRVFVPALPRSGWQFLTDGHTPASGYLGMKAPEHSPKERRVEWIRARLKSRPRRGSRG